MILNELGIFLNPFVLHMHIPEKKKIHVRHSPTHKGWRTKGI